MAEERKLMLLNYYRRNHSVENVLFEQFAFSLIYNNIAPNKIHEALNSVGLSQMPNLFFLIQVDDYPNVSKRLAIENEFTIKAHIIDAVRSCLMKTGSEYAVANLTGTDKMIAFLTVGNTVRGEYLVQLSTEICEKVHLFTNYSVSICISELCTHLSSFPKCYEQACKMLNESFFLGKKIQTRVVNTTRDVETNLITDETCHVMQSIYRAVSKSNRILFGQAMVSLFDDFHKNGRSREQTQLFMGKVVDKMEEYTLSCGVEDKKYVADLSSQAKENIFSCYYADDICLVLMEYYEALLSVIEASGTRSAGDAFKEIVQQYIKEHYKERIYLDDIAASCGYSKYYFCRQLKTYYCAGLSDLVNQYRIDCAKELLCNGHYSVEEIVQKVGFSSANYFEIVFRKKVGLSPTVYRKEKCHQS